MENAIVRERDGPGCVWDVIDRQYVTVMASVLTPADRGRYIEREKRRE